MGGHLGLDELEHPLLLFGDRALLVYLFDQIVDLGVGYGQPELFTALDETLFDVVTSTEFQLLELFNHGEELELSLDAQGAIF